MTINESELEKRESVLLSNKAHSGQLELAKSLQWGHNDGMYLTPNNRPKSVVVIGISNTHKLNG
jgi:uncharacterized protein YcfL